MNNKTTNKKYKNNEYNMNKRDFLIMKSWEATDFLGNEKEQYEAIYNWYKKPSDWKLASWNGYVYKVNNEGRRFGLKILGTNSNFYSIGYLEKSGPFWYLVYKCGRCYERYIKVPDHIALFAELYEEV